MPFSCVKNDVNLCLCSLAQQERACICRGMLDVVPSSTHFPASCVRILKHPPLPSWRSLLPIQHLIREASIAANLVTSGSYSFDSGSIRGCQLGDGRFLHPIRVASMATRLVMFGSYRASDSSSILAAKINDVQCPTKNMSLSRMLSPTLKFSSQVPLLPQNLLLLALFLPLVLFIFWPML